MNSSRGADELQYVPSSSPSKNHSFRFVKNAMSCTSLNGRFAKLLRNKRSDRETHFFRAQIPLAINCAIVAAALVYIWFAAFCETIRWRGACVARAQLLVASSRICSPAELGNLYLSWKIWKKRLPNCSREIKMSFFCQLILLLKGQSHSTSIPRERRKRMKNVSIIKIKALLKVYFNYNFLDKILRYKCFISWLKNAGKCMHTKDPYIYFWYSDRY